MSDIFEGLNDIQWVDLSSAYGNADEIPAWIRRLASKDANVRAQAIECLGDELEHQFTVYTASVAAIPFLTRLLTEREIEGKADILMLLGFVAHAARDFVAYDQDGTVVYGPDGIPYGEVVMRVLEALRIGVSVYLDLLMHDDIAVSMRAADVASLSGGDHGLAEELHAAYSRETNQEVRANLVLALARLTPITNHVRVLFLELLRSHTESMLRSVAALALVQSAPTEAPEDAIMLLGHVLSSDADTLANFDALPCLHDFPESAISSALRRIDAARLRPLLPALLSAVPQAQYEQGAALVDLLASIVFEGQEWTATDTRPSAVLTNEQREVLAKVAISQGAWEWGNWYAVLLRHGLPTDRDSLASYLGISLPPDSSTDELAEDMFEDPLERFQDLSKHILDDVLPDAKLDDSPQMIEWADDSQNNIVMTVNDALLFRFPKHAQAIDEMERELWLLRALQGKLPLPIPNPIYSSLEPREVGQAFMGYAKLPGKPLYREMLESVPGEQTVQRLAEQLGSFLHSLHTLLVDEVFDFELPNVGGREQWARMYDDIREKLFPPMRPDARDEVAAHFERALDDPAMFVYTPVLIHGDFGASNILYDAKARTISGIIDWSSAGLGDPAADLAALICPASYGEAFAQRLTGVYPGVEELLPRVRFYIGTFALQEALFGVEHDDAQALARGLAEYV